MFSLAAIINGIVKQSSPKGTRLAMSPHTGWCGVLSIIGVLLHITQQD